MQPVDCHRQSFRAARRSFGSAVFLIHWPPLPAPELVLKHQLTLRLLHHIKRVPDS